MERQSHETYSPVGGQLPATRGRCGATRRHMLDRSAAGASPGGPSRRCPPPGGRSACAAAGARWLRLFVAGFAGAAAAPAAQPSGGVGSAAVECPSGMSLVDTFSVDEVQMGACEDLQQPGGSIALVSSEGTEWFTKVRGHDRGPLRGTTIRPILVNVLNSATAGLQGYEVFGSAPSGSDDDYTTLA
eukprot:SAG31_NODE_11443_length_1030_cov_0.566058_1_plen_187_part_00